MSFPTNTQDEKILRQIFNKAKHAILIREEELKGKRAIVNNVVNQVLSFMMKKDKLFASMYLEMVYTGSYFDGLRIKNADEFDINIVLKLPVRRDMISLETQAQSKVFACLRLDYSAGDPTVFDSIELARCFNFKLVDGEYFVNPAALRNWMQSILDKAKDDINVIQTEGVENVNLSSSGPARTLKIKLWEQDATVDVDLVPVFRLEWGKWNETEDFQWGIIHLVPEARRRLYLVPKEHPNIKGPYWRKHFPEVEKILLRGSLAAKPVIKILKLLRDNWDWKCLASYYIKTLVLLEVVEHWQDLNYWHDLQLPRRIFDMLEILKSCFYDGRIPHLLYRNENLLTSPTEIERLNIYHRLSRMIRQMKENFNNIEEFFLKSAFSGNVEKEKETSWCTVL